MGKESGDLPDRVPPVSLSHMLAVLGAAYGENARAALTQCLKLAGAGKGRFHIREDNVSIVALHGVEHPRLMNAAAGVVGKAAKQAIADSRRKPNSEALNPKIGKRTPGGKVSWVNDAEEVRLFDTDKPGSLAKRDRFGKLVDNYGTSAEPPTDDMGDTEQREQLFQAGALYLLWERSAWLAELAQTDSDAWWAYRLVVQAGKTERQAAATLAVSVSTLHGSLIRAKRYLASIPPPPMGKEWRIGDPIHPPGSHEGYGWRLPAETKAGYDLPYSAEQCYVISNVSAGHIPATPVS